MTANKMNMADYSKLVNKTTNKGKRYKHEEADLQVEVVKYIRTFYPKAFIAMAPITKCSIIQGVRNKRMGYTSGQPDITLLEPSKYVSGISFHGLCLELKTPTGVVSPSQKAVHAHLKAKGYAVIVCRTLDEAIGVIAAYMA